MADAKVNPPLAKGEEKLVVPKGILIYPHLFRKDKVREDYNCIVAVDPDHPGLRDFAETVKAFGRKAFESVGGFPAGMTWCIRSGPKWLADKNKPPTGKLADLITKSTLIVGSSKHPPTVSVPLGGKLVNLDDEAVIAQADRGRYEKMFYSGMKGSMEGKLAAFNGRYPSVVLWINQVVRLGGGENLGSAADPNKAFGGMYDPNDDTVGAGQASPAGGLDDEIEF